MSSFKLKAALSATACIATLAGSGAGIAHAAAKPNFCADAVATHVKPVLSPRPTRRQGPRPMFLADVPTTGSGTLGPYDYGKAEAYREDILAEGGEATMYDSSSDLFDLAYSFDAGGGC